MLAPLLLLAALILPSAQQTQMVDSKISLLTTWLTQWRTLSSARELSTLEALDEIVEAGTEVRAQLEQL